jgi:hypothetical protein
MSPFALVRACHNPNTGAKQYLTPSTPGLGSSVTSNLSIGHALSADTSRAPVPASPVQLHSARN